MSIFRQIIEGLANLDEGYARDKRQSKREADADARQAERDKRLNEMTLKRDQLLAAEQAVRDARLHGNSMELQRAQIEAEKARVEFQAAQDNLRQDKNLQAQREENREQRRFSSTEANKDREFRGRESEAERGWRTGERREGQTFLSGERQAGETFQRGEREGTQKWQSGERQAGETFQRGEREGMQKWRSGEREAGEVFQRGERLGSETFQRGERLGSQDWRTSERKGTEGFQSRESRREHQRRLQSMKVASDLRIDAEDKIERNKLRQMVDRIAAGMPDNMNPAEKEAAVRQYLHRSLYSLPMSEAQGRIDQIEATKGGVLFPGYNARIAREGAARGNPFGASETGDTGMTIQDLMDMPGNPQAQPNPMDNAPTTPMGRPLRSLRPSQDLYD